jgi:hypothetical protein
VIDQLILENPFINLIKYPANPIKDLMSETSFEVGHSMIDLIFSRSTTTPSWERTWLK